MKLKNGLAGLAISGLLAVPLTACQMTPETGARGYDQQEDVAAATSDDELERMRERERLDEEVERAREEGAIREDPVPEDMPREFGERPDDPDVAVSPVPPEQWPEEPLDGEAARDADDDMARAREREEADVGVPMLED